MTCNFFQWAEPTYTERAREVITDLNIKLGVKTQEMQNLAAKMNFEERKAIVLNEELMLAREKSKEVDDLKLLIVKNGKQICLLKKILMIAIVVIMFLVFT